MSEWPKFPVKLFEAAAVLGVARSTVCMWSRKGVLKTTRVGRAQKIHPDDLKAFAQAHGLPRPAGWITATEAARRMNVQIETIWHLHHAGHIEGKPFGIGPQRPKKYYSEKSVNAYLTRRVGYGFNEMYQALHISPNTLTKWVRMGIIRRTGPHRRFTDIDLAQAKRVVARTDPRFTTIAAEAARLRVPRTSVCYWLLQAGVKPKFIVGRWKGHQRMYDKTAVDFVLDSLELKTLKFARKRWEKKHGNSDRNATADQKVLLREVRTS